MMGNEGDGVEGWRPERPKCRRVRGERQREERQEGVRMRPAVGGWQVGAGDNKGCRRSSITRDGMIAAKSLQ